MFLATKHVVLALKQVVPLLKLNYKQDINQELSIILQYNVIKKIDKKWWFANS